MGADVIQAQYDQLEAIGRRFAANANASETLRSQVQRSMNTLRNGWDGKGSTAFFAEMDGEVLPALQRLMKALDEAHRVTQQISGILRAAEEDAAAPFKGGAIGIVGALGGTAVVGVASAGLAPSKDWTWGDTLKTIGKTLLWSYKDRDAFTSILAARGNWGKMVRFVRNADGTFRAFGSQTAKEALGLPSHFTRFGQAAIDRSVRSHSLFDMIQTAVKSDGPFSARAAHLLDDIKSIGGIKTPPLWSVNGFLKNVKGPAIISSLVTLGSNVYEFGFGASRDQGLLSREFLTSTGADVTAGLGIVGVSTAIGTMIPIPGVGTATGFVVGLGLQYAYDRWGKEAWRDVVDGAAQRVSTVLNDTWQAAKPVADQIGRAATDVWITVTQTSADLGRGAADVFKSVSGAASARSFHR